MQVNELSSSITRDWRTRGGRTRRGSRPQRVPRVCYWDRRRPSDRVPRMAACAVHKHRPGAGWGPRRGEPLPGLAREHAVHVQSSHARARSPGHLICHTLVTLLLPQHPRARHQATRDCPYAPGAPEMIHTNQSEACSPCLACSFPRNPNESFSCRPHSPQLPRRPGRRWCFLGRSCSLL